MIELLKRKFFLTAFTLVCGYSNLALSLTNEINQLEIDVWTAEDPDLLKIENSLIRELQINPKSTIHHYLLSHTYIRRISDQPGDSSLLKQASDLAQQAIELNPEEEYGYLALAEILDLTGSSEKAVELVNQAFMTFKKPSWRLLFAKGRLSIAHASNKTVLDILDKALLEKDSLKEVIIPYVVAVLNTGDIDDIIRNIEQWNKKYPSDSFLHLLAAKKIDLEKYTEANNIYKSIFSKKIDLEAKINSGILEYKYLNNNKNAIKQFQDAINSKVTISDETASALYAHFGIALFKDKQFSESEKNILLSLRSNTSVSSISRFLDKNLRDTPNSKELLTILEKINLEFPGNSMIHAYMGEILAENLNSPAESVEYFTNAITLDPKRSEFYNALGLSYYKLKEFSQALSLFSAATKVNPTDATAKYNEACAFAKLEQNENAITALSIAVSLDPRLQLTAQNDPDFSRIQNVPSFRSIVYEETKMEGLSH